MQYLDNKYTQAAAGAALLFESASCGFGRMAPSRQPGLMDSLIRDFNQYHILKRLKLKVNQDKSAVDRPWRRKFLGFTFTARRPNRCKVSESAIRKFKLEVKRTTKRTRGYSIHKIARELRQYILGWKAYFDFAEAKSIFKELDSWVRRRLRCYLLKQWVRRRYRELRRLGVSRDLAWNTTKSAHGP